GGTSVSDSQRTINNLGTANWTGAINIGLGAGPFGEPGTFNNQSGAVFNILNDQGLNIGTASFNNFGTMTKSGSTGTTSIQFFSGTFINQGLVDVQSGTLDYEGTPSQTAGATRMAGGNLLMNSSGSGTLALEGGLHLGTGIITGPVNDIG